MILPLVLAAIASLSFAIANTTAGKTGQSIATLDNIFYRYIASIVVFGLLFLVSLVFYPITQFDARALIFTLGIGVFGFTGLLLYFKAISTAPIGLSIVISNTSIIITILISSLLYGDKLRALQIVGLFASLIGIYLISTGKNTTKKPLKGLWYAVLNSIVWGITFAFYRFGLPAGGPFTLSFLIEIVGIFILLAVFYLKKLPLPDLKAIAKNPENKILFPVMALAGGIGVNMRIIAQSIGNVSVVETVITALTPLFAIVIARFWLNEKLSKVQYIGSLVVLIGVLTAVLG